MNRVRITVDDLRRASDQEIRHTWSGSQWIKWLDAACVLRDPSFRNVVLIKLQMSRATLVADRGTWLRVGRRVPHDESGIRIIKAAEPSRLDLVGSSVQGHGVSTVWDVSQTYGPDLLPPSAAAGAGTTTLAIYNALVSIADEAGHSFTVNPACHAVEPTSSSDDRGRIASREDAGTTLAAAMVAHELAHVRMHKRTRDRTCRGLAQLEANSVAYLLLAHFGRAVDVSPSLSLAAAAARFGKKHPERAIQMLGGRVLFTARRLIDATERHLHASETTSRRARQRRGILVEAPDLLPHVLPPDHGPGL
ncbi:hypothetical protein [Kribbella deserti]|uniref:Peptidase M48 domain-containing protein n=1 Tax=Kribbella deserti TaxID=1926257 RepID=A0ABV6QCU6_9ACTN